MHIAESPILTESIEFLKKRNREQAERGDIPYVHIMTFGCQQNEADSELLYGYAEECGYTKTEDPAEASLLLVNTCAIREHAESKALSLLGRLREYKDKRPSLLIGACGCMLAEAHRVRQLQSNFPYVDFTLDPASLYRLPEVIRHRIENDEREFVVGDARPEIAEGIPVRRTSRDRAYVSIMYGCNNFCSYCIVPYVRGRERSRSSADIEAEVRTLVADGCREITLLGQNVNSYGGDCDFPTLLARLDAIPGDYVLRFMTSHPKDASDDLIHVMRDATHVEPHCHLPLQSGSDRILKAMNRHYTKERYLSIVQKLREAIPDIVLSTDIIVGFPGETEEDYEQTLALLREVKFDLVYSFAYSPRKGTPAATYEEQVPEDVKSARLTRLMQEQDEYGALAAARFLGRDLRVFVEGPSRDRPDVYSARSAGGRLVHIPAAPESVGKFLSVHIERTSPYALYGTVNQ